MACTFSEMFLLSAEACVFVMMIVFPRNVVCSCLRKSRIGVNWFLDKVRIYKILLKDSKCLLYYLNSNLKNSKS